MSNSTQTFIRISWDATNQYIFYVVVGFSPTEKVQASLNEILDLLKQKKASKMLLEISQSAPYSKELETWIEQVWEPQAIAAGLRTQAFIVPASFFTRKLLDNSMRKSQNSALERGFFDSVDAAREWLKDR